MAKYAAVYKQTEWLLVTFDAENDESAREIADEMFGSTDAESLKIDVQLETLEKVEE